MTNKLEGTEQACCAHLTVTYRTEPVGGGAVRGYWQCKDCSTQFIPEELRRLGASGVNVEGLARELADHFVFMISGDRETAIQDAMRRIVPIVRKHIAQPAPPEAEQEAK